MALTCDQCGGPLKPKGEERRITCGYCGCVTDLDADRPARSSDGDAQKTEGDEEVIPVSGTKVVLGVVVLSALIVGVALIHDHFKNREAVVRAHYLLALERIKLETERAQRLGATGRVTFSGDGTSLTIRFDRRRPPRRPPRRPAPERFGWTASGTCVVDADGDGVDDVASTTWGYAAGHRLTLLSGADGKVLWRSAHVRKNTRHYCISRRWVGLARPGFRVRFYDVRRPDHPVTVQLRDELSRYVWRGRCVSLESKDGSVVGVELPSGKHTRCRRPGRKDRPPYYPGMTLRHERRARVKHQSTIYEVSIRRRGTPMLTATASSRGRRLWSRELGITMTRSGVALALAEDVIVVYGATTARSATGVFLGLDPRTGQVRYTHRLRRGGDSPSFFHFNGKYLLVAFAGGIYAHEPATGKLAWKLTY